MLPAGYHRRPRVAAAGPHRVAGRINAAQAAAAGGAGRAGATISVINVGTAASAVAWISTPQQPPRGRQQRPPRTLHRGSEAAAAAAATAAWRARQRSHWCARALSGRQEGSTFTQQHVRRDRNLRLCGRAAVAAVARMAEPRWRPFAGQQRRRGAGVARDIERTAGAFYEYGFWLLGSNRHLWRVRQPSPIEQAVGAAPAGKQRCAHVLCNSP